MERLIERCCGLDVHKATVSACVRVTPRLGGEVKQEVRTFATTTPDLLALREWLSEQRVTHVAPILFERMRTVAPAGTLSTYKLNNCSSRYASTMKMSFVAVATMELRSR